MAESMESVHKPEHFLSLLSNTTFIAWIKGPRVIWDHEPHPNPVNDRLYGFNESTTRVLRRICASLNEGLRRGRRSLPRLYRTEITDLGGERYEARLADRDEDDEVGPVGFTLIEVQLHAKFIWSLVHCLLHYNLSPPGIDKKVAETKPFLERFNEMYNLINEETVTLKEAKYFTLCLSINPLFFQFNDTMTFLLKCFNVNLMIEEYGDELNADCGKFKDYLWSDFGYIAPVSYIIGPSESASVYNGMVNAMRLYWNTIRHAQQVRGVNDSLPHRWCTLQMLNNNLRPLFIHKVVPMLWFFMARRYKEQLYCVTNPTDGRTMEKSYTDYMFEEAPFIMPL